MNGVTADGGYHHATAIVVRERGVLLRGAAGAGKSSLASLLLDAARHDGAFTRLVGDDRVWLGARHGRLVARAHPATAGLLERFGLGIVAVPHEQACVITLVVDLIDADRPLDRMPTEADGIVSLAGVVVPRLAVLAGPASLRAGRTVLDKLSSDL